jgi:hypothetical protein
MVRTRCSAATETPGRIALAFARALPNGGAPWHRCGACCPVRATACLAEPFRQFDRFARLARRGSHHAVVGTGRVHRTKQGAPAGGAPLPLPNACVRDMPLHRALRRMPGMNGVLLADVLSTLPNDMLHKVDLTSMAHALEVRTPFLDKRVVEFAFSLPA